ncbi:hypothetical protein HYV30_01575 [Candidatus Kaiserbacteria bacterium]|nr:hypothetical protein [Candidatus Kaiserbacteria bacterium]
MKKLTIATFATRENAEKAVNRLHKEVDVPTSEISYVYKDVHGQVKEVDPEEVSRSTPAEGAKTGAAWGGAIGAGIGLATVAGALPVIGPIFVAGPLAAALGLGAGALGTAAAGAITGAAAGGLIGALVSWGISEPAAKKYADRVEAGDILVAVHADEKTDVAKCLEEEGATNVEIYTVQV